MTYGLLDIRGMMLKGILGGKDPDGWLNAEGGTDNTAEYGFYRFIDMHLLPALEMVSPRNVIAVWDGGSDYRKGLFPGYKKKRSEREISDTLKAEIEKCEGLIQSLLKSIGTTQCSVRRVEADDVIAYLCEKLPPGKKLVFTGDADLVQLDNDEVDVIYQGEMVKLSSDLPNPRDVAIIKSLVGDSSDEYPGIAQFGPAKIDAIVAEFGDDALQDLEECVKTGNYDLVREAFGMAESSAARKGLQLILDGLDDWPLMYELAILHPELCEGVRNRKFVGINWTKRVPNFHTMTAVLQEGGCEAEFKDKFQPYTPVYELVTQANWDGFVDRFMTELHRTPFFAFDYESVDVLKHPDFNEAKRSAGDYVDVLSQSITGMSICYGEHLQYTSYICVDHYGTENVPDEYLKDILETVEESGKYLVAHNASFELALTDTNFLYQPKSILDTRLFSHYVDENDSNHLKDLSRRFLNYQQASYKDTLEAAGVENMQQLTGAQVLNYGCDDSLVTAQLFDLFYIITHLEGTYDFCAKQETDTNHVLYEGFESGIRIDYDRLEELAAEDLSTFETSMANIRATLQTNCKEPDPAKAKELLNEVTEFEAAKMRHDGKSPAVIEKKLESLVNAYELATQYRPLIEVAKEVKFTPTALQITKLAQGEFGIKADLKGVTPTKITQFLGEVEEELKEAGRSPGVELARFLQCLAAASDELKKREGIFFEDLVRECNVILSKNAPKETQGDELNLDSPIQMSQVLYCKLGLPIRVHGKLNANSMRDKLGYREGAPSTDDKAIDTALAEDCPEGDWRREVLVALKEAKAANTRRKNYWRPYPLWQHPRDGLLHGSIMNCGTVSKRFTGSNPNLFQLSGKDGGRVRSIVLTKADDHVILSPDFNGEELRITASLSNDRVMTDAYIGENQKDLHSITSAAIAGVILGREQPSLAEQIQFEMINGLLTMQYEDFLAWLHHEDDYIATIFKNIRKLAKACNFLLIYVGGPGTLSRNLGVPYEVAEQFLSAAYATYPRLKPWQDESILFAQEHGYVLTSYGNRRHIGDGIFSDDNGVRTRLERQAVNSQVQGTGSDIMKVVMSEIRDTGLFKDTGASLIVPPYDEIAVSVPRQSAWDCWLGMQEIMTLTPPGHAVPQLPELKAGALNWGEMTELGAFPTRDEFESMLDEQLAAKVAA
jgi:DNA polymerase I-like protein with 3'-5' exonuclease and polymerase domains/5'-3' exonuclease